MTSASDDIIRILGLTSHPEGGNYVENYRDVPTVTGSRGSVSSIYFLLRAGERSHWHRFDAVELWCYHAGAPLQLTTWVEGRALVKYCLGSDVAAGQRPLVIQFRHHCSSIFASYYALLLLLLLLLLPCLLLILISIIFFFHISPLSCFHLY